MTPAKPHSGRSLTFGKALAAFALLAWLGGCQPGLTHAQWSLLDGARTHPDYHGQVPKRSDVIFSSRFKRDDAVEVAEAYGASRVEWGYSADPAFVDSINKRIGWYGGAVNAVMPLPGNVGIALDLDGKGIVPPWMKSWAPLLMSSAHPAAEKSWQDAARKFINLGAKSIQVDDQMSRYHAVHWGADFSPAALQGFKAFLHAYPRQGGLSSLITKDMLESDYKNYLAQRHGINTAKEYLEKYKGLPSTKLWSSYLKESAASNFIGFRKYVDGIGSGRVAFSANLQIKKPDDTDPLVRLAPYVDYAIVESKIDDMDKIVAQAALFRALGVGYAPSLLPKSTQENRLAIAEIYALGGQPLVPWDVYIADQPRDRYFGSVQDYGDLYHYVRKYPEEFDGFEYLPSVGVLVNMKNYRQEETERLVSELTRRNIPWGYVVSGDNAGHYQLGAEHLSHFQRIIALNPQSDFSAVDKAAIAAVAEKVEWSVNRLDYGILDSFAPFVDAGTLKLFPRGRTQPQGHPVLQIHVLNESTETGKPAAGECRRTFGVRREALGGLKPLSVRWSSIRGAASPAHWENSAGFFFHVPECVLWGILHVELE